MSRRMTVAFACVVACALSYFVHAATGQKTISPQLAKPVRRALLVGIDNYERDPDFQSVKCEDPVRKQSPQRKLTNAKGGFSRLEGPVDDVCMLRQLLITSYGFEAKNIHVVQDQNATHQGVLDAFKRYLIDEPAPGDICLFFYSGHGSQVKNTLGGETDQLDETLVPYDWNRPIQKREDAKDIRDKEVFKLFREAAQKVTLTALFDSCHSGDIARGGVSEERAKTGDSETNFDFREPPPDEAQKGVSDDKYLENAGVLVISAARDFEEAKEKEYNGQWHGNFTYSLIEVLRTPNAKNLSAARVFDKLVVQMKSHKASHEPVMVGSVARRQKTLFGEPVDPERRPEVNVESIDSTGKIILQGGRALGFHQNAEFVRKGAGGREIRIRITEEPDYVKSIAEVVAADPSQAKTIASAIKPNDTFVLDKWAMIGEPDLSVWIAPSKFSAAQLVTLAKEIQKLNESASVKVVSDPTADVATHYLSYDGTNWILKLPGNDRVPLGPTITSQSILSALKSTEGLKLFISLPPSTELAAKIKLGTGTNNTAVGLAKAATDADYLLVGRARTDGATTILEYAWLLPEATTGVAKPSEPNNAVFKRANAPVSPLPPITDWKADAKDLEEFALRLSKIAGWVKLDSPQGDGGRFAYRLVLKNGKGEPLSGSNATLSEGDIFSIALVADDSLLQPPIEQRHVYVLTIDQFGKSELLYPNLRSPDIQIPDTRSQSIAREISLGQVKVCGPDPKKSGCRNPGILGAETFVMLTTTEPLSDPSILQGDGVRTPQELEEQKRSKGARGADSPLTNLLTGIGSTARSGESIVPLNWSVQQVFLNSVPRQ
jgi:Caspase domain